MRIGVLALCCAAGAGAGCSDEGDEEARRRDLLQNEPPRRTIAEVRRELQLFDARGELLPSDETVAGVVLPKGLTLYRSFEREWYYKADRVPADALERYFSQRLMSTTLERREGAVVFGGAVPRDNLKAPRLRVQVTDLRGPVNASQVYIKQAAAIRPKPPADIEAQLREMQRYAR